MASQPDELSPGCDALYLIVYETLVSLPFGLHADTCLS